MTSTTNKKTVLITILGTVLDRKGKGVNRWDKWRPNISICQQNDLIIDTMELLHDTHNLGFAKNLIQDVESVSPETNVNNHIISITDPWDFEQVYSAFFDFAQKYDFDEDNFNYLIHITTGTHVAQICLYLLTEAGFLPGKLIQTSPDKEAQSNGTYQVIDLDLSKYDQIASRFAIEHKQGAEYLKSGIQTKNKKFNTMIAQLEQVSVRSNAPILITGPTGAGKSQLAKKVFELRKRKGLIEGDLVSVNCATLKGENAMSTLFGHKKGSFTGAMVDRPGLLKQAHKGLLFLDEVGELGLDEQAMLLKAIEEKEFMPFGSDQTVKSDFQLIAGTNKNLSLLANSGEFREDLLARIDLWTYQLPSLKDRIEDIEANIDFELEAIQNKKKTLIKFNKSARALYLEFSKSSQATWKNNFRDLNASMTRMTTLCDGGRITDNITLDEIDRLKSKWSNHTPESTAVNLIDFLSKESIATLDYFDQEQLKTIIKICKESKNMADAGRKLFAVSRLKKTTVNDSHRVKVLLNKYNISANQLF